MNYNQNRLFWSLASTKDSQYLNEEVQMTQRNEIGFKVIHSMLQRQKTRSIFEAEHMQTQSNKSIRQAQRAQKQADRLKGKASKLLEQAQRVKEQAKEKIDEAFDLREEAKYFNAKKQYNLREAASISQEIQMMETGRISQNEMTHIPYKSMTNLNQIKTTKSIQSWVTQKSQQSVVLYSQNYGYFAQKHQNHQQVSFQSVAQQESGNQVGTTAIKLNNFESNHQKPQLTNQNTVYHRIRFMSNPSAEFYYRI